MSNTYNHRRIATPTSPTRSRSDGWDEPESPEDNRDLSDRREKNQKVDDEASRTAIFICWLLILCSIACVVLALGYWSRIRAVQITQSGALHVLERLEIVAPVPIKNKLLDFQSIKLTEASNMKKKESSQGSMWQGCLAELPSPLRTPATEIIERKKGNGFDYNRRHIVSPPTGPATLVCCNTTKGPLNIEVHRSWAPNGAERFLDMVNSGFFSSEVGLFRAMKGFLVQFGLPGDPSLLKRYHELGNLPDDPNWLPKGPSGRLINGTKRFQKGYLAYAGAGKNSRGTQLIMAFEDNLYLGGGSPWEVPFGQLFGSNSFETLSKICTKYGEAPSQGKIMNRGKSYLKENFPELDYITNCIVVKDDVPWIYDHNS